MGFDVKWLIDDFVLQINLENAVDLEDFIDLN
jgi:hypothetical protein